MKRRKVDLAGIGTLGRILFLMAILTSTLASTEILEVSSLCAKGQFTATQHRQIDGAVIISQNEKNLDCTVTFSAEYVSQRFLIRFEEFNMECSDRLYIYDSANAISNPRADLNCRYLSSENIKPIRTRGHYLTLRFVADAWGMDEHRFKMIITAYKDTNQGCRDSFHCAQDSMCISNRLLCDDIDNCNDGSDELRSANCTGNFLLELFSPRGNPTLGTALICGLLVISSVIAMLCICGRNKASSGNSVTNNSANNSTRTTLNNHSKAGGSNNGTLIMLTEKTGNMNSLRSLKTHSTLDSIQKSGNLHLPAVDQGYKIIKTEGHRLRRCFLGD